MFRESVSLGARFLKRHNISLQFAHISNGIHGDADVDDDIAPIPATPAGNTPVVQPQGLQAAQNTQKDQHGLTGIVSEVRAGILAHDIGFLDGSREDGIDLNLEVYFVSPT